MHLGLLYNYQFSTNLESTVNNKITLGIEEHNE